MPNLASVGGLSTIDLGCVTVRHRERVIQSATCSIAVEPLVMKLLVTLIGRAGRLVTRREIFEACWGSAPVGDDSLNRLAAVLRKSLQQVSGTSIKIETIPGAGYILRLGREPEAEAGIDTSLEVQQAIQAAVDSWRLALPEPDHIRLEQLRRACELEPWNARALAMLALLCRHAAEYGGPELVADYVRECESAARRAIEIDPQQPEAHTALISVVPLFGRWSEGRKRLLAILERSPDCPVPVQDLANLEMATGRVRAGKQLRDRLIAADPLAACYCYKSVYQHWAVGDLIGMDHAADRAMALWPSHPAVWIVRLWTLAYTDRLPAALAMLEDSALRPTVPQPALAFHRQVLSAALHRTSAGMASAVEASLTLSRTGPASAIASMFALGLFGRHDELFRVAEAYFLRQGNAPVPVRHTDAELSLNEQHRRLTQILFMPVFADARRDPRFDSICQRIGLSRYWEENDLTPDFLT